MILSITGTSNSGKTEFLKKFIQKYPKYVTPVETYRDIPDLSLYEKGTEESQRLIRDFMFKQQKEFWAKRDTQRHIITDRNLLDNLACTFFLYQKGLMEEKQIISDEFMEESLAMTHDSMGHHHLIYFCPLMEQYPIPEKEGVDNNWRLWIDEKLKSFYYIWKNNEWDMGIFPQKKCTSMQAIAGNTDQRIAIAANILDENGNLDGGMKGNADSMMPQILGPNGLEISSDMLENPDRPMVEDFGFNAPNIEV